MSDTITDKHTESITTPERFAEWLETSWAGQRIVYHVGLLAADRLGVVGKDAKAVYTASTQRIDILANEVWKAYEKGLVCLVQRRYLGETQYIAVKRRRSKDQ